MTRGRAGTSGCSRSNESGRFEVYVAPFPGPGRKWQVSTRGGFYPCWRTDGREIFYQALDGTLTAAEITLAVATVKAPFKVPPPGYESSVFHPARDGRRVLVVVVEPVAQETMRPLTIFLNWTASRSRSPRTKTPAIVGLVRWRCRPTSSLAA